MVRSLFPPDSNTVEPFSNQLWALIALLTGGCVLGALYTMAAQVGHATKVHDLKVRVMKLQADYHAHLEAIAQRDGFADSDVIVLNEVPVNAPKSGKHAA